MSVHMNVHDVVGLFFAVLCAAVLFGILGLVYILIVVCIAHER